MTTAVVLMFFGVVVFFPEQVDGLLILTTVALLGSIQMLRRRLGR